ncbi:MAG: hypothetical protein ACYDCS_05320 [Candidatus Dormibacteria bacterium]
MTSELAARSVPSGERRLALAAALGTVVLWASTFVGIRAAGRGLAPGSLALARLVVGTVALGVLLALFGGLLCRVGVAVARGTGVRRSIRRRITNERPLRSGHAGRPPSWTRGPRV